MNHFNYAHFRLINNRAKEIVVFHSAPPGIGEYFKARANNHERWLHHMRREQDRYIHPA